MCRLPVFLSVLLALSGCVQPPLADDSPPSGVEDADLPPGITTDGVSNASRLLDAHVSALNETGWEERHEMVFRGPHYEGVGLLAESETIAATPGMAAVHTVRERRFEFSSGSRTAVWNGWYDAERQLTKLRCPSGEFVYSTDEPPHHLELLTVRRLPVYGWLRAGDYELTAVDRSGNRTLFTFVADDESAWDRTHDGRFENATFVIDSAGRIHRFETVGRWTTDDGVEVTRRDRYELLDVGVSNLESPEWAATAKRDAVHGGCGAPAGD